MLWLLLINKSNFIILVVMPRQLVKSRIGGLTKKTSSSKKTTKEAKLAKQAQKILRLAARGSTKGERTQAWVKFQKTYKIKDKNLLAKARAIVQSGSSRTKAFEKAIMKEAGLNTFKSSKPSGGRLSGKSMKLLPSPEKPPVSMSKELRDVSVLGRLKGSSGPALEGNRFTGIKGRVDPAKKRSRDYEFEREEGVKVSYRPSAKHSYSGTMGIINKVFPGILTQIEAGNSEGVAEIIANAKGNLEAAAYREYTDTFSAITSLVSRIKKGHANDANTIAACDNVAKEMKTFYEGNAPDFVGTQTAIDSLVNNLRMSRTQMNTAPAASVEGVMHKMNLTKAEAIQEERRAQEEIYAMEDANKAFAAQAAKAEAEEKEALNRFSAAKRTLAETETVDNLELLKKRKAEAVVEQAAAAKEYQENLAKKISFQRQYKINDYALKNKKGRFDAGFYGEKRKRDSDILDYCAKVLVMSQERSDADHAAVESKINAILNKLPEVVEKSADLAKDAINSAPPEDQEAEQINAIKSEIAADDQAINTLDQREADLQEELEVIPTLIKAEATKRVKGESDASGQALRIRQETARASLAENRKQRSFKKQHRDVRAAELQKMELNRQTLNSNQAASTLIREGASNTAEAWVHVRSETQQFNGENVVQLDVFADQSQVNRDLDETGASILYGIKKEPKIEPIPPKLENGEFDKTARVLDGIIEDDKGEIDMGYDNYEKLLTTADEYFDSGDFERGVTMKKAADSERDRILRLQDKFDKHVEAKEQLIASKVKTDPMSAPTYAPPTTTPAERLNYPIGRESQAPVFIPNAPPLQTQLRTFETVRPKLVSRMTPSRNVFRTTTALVPPSKSGRKNDARSYGKEKTIGGFLVGNRPDPLLNLQFWKDLYNKRK